MALTYRKHTRKKAQRLPINVRTAGTFAWSPATVIDMSQGGAQINVTEIFAIGEKVELEFTTVARTGKRSRRLIDATIVWRRGMRYGCQFSVKDSKAD